MTPYTYLIGWKDQEKYYYGVRFAKGCAPKDLWNTYFTSSKYVKQMVEMYGDPNIVQIRKTFDAASKARKWEEKVLKRIGAIKRTDFINKTDNISISPECSSPKGKIWVTNQKQERLVTQIPQGWKVGRLPHGRKPSEKFVHNKPHTPETKRLISQRKKGVSVVRPHVDVSGEKNPMYGRMWITNGSINKTILKHEIIPEGFTKGKIQNGG